MLMFAPTEQLMHNYSGMGLGGGTGSGIDPFITNKQIVFMGDGTFFHSGQVAISNSRQSQRAGHSATSSCKTSTTAMTGHQEHPGTELDVTGQPKPGIQDIADDRHAAWPAAVAALRSRRLSPAHRQAELSQAMLEETILRRWSKSGDRRQGMRHHPPPQRIARARAQHDQGSTDTCPSKDAHERDAGGLRELPGMHQGKPPAPA